MNIPTMAQVARTKQHGGTVASTFAGCGGSSLGYRMAGFRVLWANEFVARAAATYRRNAPKYTVVDRRDIREIDPGDVLAACKLKKGELDILDGSPPCVSFSMSGARERLWGQERDYYNKQQRTDNLFDEYLRMVEGVRPKVAVSENVLGMLRGNAKAFFLLVMERFGDLGYTAKGFILKAQFLGLPQKRERLFIIAVREDLGKEPVPPRPRARVRSLTEACPDIAAVCLVNRTTGFGKTVMRHPTLCPTIMAGGIGAFNRSQYYVESTPTSGLKPKRAFTVAELKAICGFPPDFILPGTYAAKWERLGCAVPPVVMKAVADTIRRQILS